jgi:hypothetical protein
MRSLLILILFTACNLENEPKQEYAKSVNYYFEIMEEFSNDSNFNLTGEISKLLPNKQYAITNNSGLIWPFFQEFDLNDNVLKSDLMSPHTITHTLLSIDGNEGNFEDGDAKLKIILKNDHGEYSFDMVIYKWNKNEWIKSVNTGNHKILKSKYNSTGDLAKVISKNIVRYSFK